MSYELFGEPVRIDYKLSMQETPKPDEVEKKDTWAEDQKEHKYYYDDAHGYEPFDPDEEGDEDDAEVGRRGDAELERDRI